MVLKVTAKDALVFSDAISQKPSQKGTGSPLGLRRATGSMDLARLLRGVSSKPESHARDKDVEETTQGEGQQRCSPSQGEIGWTRPFHQSNWSFRRSSRQARGQAICAEIWLDAQKGDLDLSLNRYCPLVEGLESARCPEVTGRREEVGKGESCLSGGEEFLVANQDNCFLIGFLLG